MPPHFDSRLQRLIEHSDADVIALVPGANMRYFTGLSFHLSERPTIALISKKGLSFIIPELEMSKLRQRTDLDVQAFSWSDKEGYEKAFEKAATDLQLADQVFGMDGMTMRTFEWFAFQNVGLSSEVSYDAGQELLNVRAIKEAFEVEAMKKAIQLSEAALETCLKQVKVGMTEKQIAEILTREMEKRGSEGHAFGPIVLSGEKSALPHGDTGERPLGNNEALLIDFGGIVDAYPADITRTVFFGKPSDRFLKQYEAVYAANEAAREVSAPGVACSMVDQAARQAISKAGYGQYFTHRTGHGLGLEVHELPNIAEGNPVLLEPGHVYTIEPGVYIPSEGGVRIEDNMHVQEDQVECLTSYTRDLVTY
ncbi:aminopeptidase P family protein [Anaerolineales bacterium]